MSVSAFERKLVVSGISEGLRMDGRSLRSPRSITVRMNPVDPSPGSVTITFGDCCVTAGARLELQKPASANADQGFVDFSVSMAGTGDDIDPETSQNNMEERLENVIFHLASSFQINSTQALKSLCVKPGVLCWHVHVTILVLQYCGNLVDTCSIAANVVLRTMRIPPVEIRSAKEQGTPIVELNPDPDEFVAVDMSHVPLLVTVVKIGSHCLIDPTEVELSGADSSVVVGANPQCNATGGRICYFSNNFGNSMDFLSTVTIMNEGSLIINSIYSALMEILDDPENLYIEEQKLSLPSLAD